MSTKTAGYTAGPWKYSGDEDGDFVIWGPGTNEFLANVDQEAFGPVPPMKIAFDINQANARLIAAAPDLYEALEAILDNDGGLGSLNFDAAKLAAARNQGWAALEKARGER